MASTNMKVGGIVLCGGHSRRMGTSKATLRWADECLLNRVLRLVGEVVSPVVVAARRGQDLPPNPPGVQLIYDKEDGVGPLAGLAAGFECLASRCDAAFVIACDQPLVRPDFVRRMIELLGEHQAVVPEHGGRRHPLTAIYRLSTRATLLDLLSNRVRRATMFSDACHARIVSATDFTTSDPTMQSLRNFNTPEEFRTLQDGE